jgi:hypothetical protein
MAQAIPFRALGAGNWSVPRFEEFALYGLSAGIILTSLLTPIRP